jgi:hypothetical protein
MSYGEYYRYTDGWEWSAVVKDSRPSVHHYCKSSTAQENSGEVSNIPPAPQSLRRYFRCP